MNDLSPANDTVTPAVLPAPPIAKPGIVDVVWDFVAWLVGVIWGGVTWPVPLAWKAWVSQKLAPILADLRSGAMSGTAAVVIIAAGVGGVFAGVYLEKKLLEPTVKAAADRKEKIATLELKVDELTAAGAVTDKKLEAAAVSAVVYQARILTLEKQLSEHGEAEAAAAAEPPVVKKRRTAAAKKSAFDAFLESLQ